MPDQIPADNPNANVGSDPLSSPYGPHHNGTDQAAGGADSSPFEDVPSGDNLDDAQRSDEPTAGGPGTTE